jgi:hemerythrin-like domain-containing protein
MLVTEIPAVAAVLRDEHTAIGTVLDYLEQACDAVTNGRAVDPEIFRDMLRFVTLFVGQCHHGKEEQILFPVLQEQASAVGLDSVLTRLTSEHVEGTTLAGAFADAVSAYADGEQAAGGSLVDSARAYAAYLRRHIAYENEYLLSRVAEAAPPATLAAAMTSFDRFEEEVMGAGTHEQLHRMIDTLGPRVRALR